MPTDNDLRQAVIRELCSRPSLANEEINVAVSEGVVTLGGKVSSFLEIYDAEHAARCVDGVKTVDADLSLKTCEPLSECHDGIVHNASHEGDTVNSPA